MAVEPIVVVGLIDGGQRRGRTIQGPPDATTLELEDGSAVTVPRDAVAYIATHRAPGQPLPQSPLGARAYKIHVAEDVHFAVWAVPPTDGAWVLGIPRAQDASFGQIEFSPRGILAMERDEPLGAMLVRSGAVHPDAVELAVSAQQGERNGKDEALPETERRPLSVVPRPGAVDRRIGDILVARGLATPEEMERAMTERKRQPSKRLGSLLLELGIVSERTLAQTLAAKFELELVDVDSAPPDPSLARMLPVRLCEEHAIFPYAMRDGDLVVAVADPLDLAGLERLRQAHAGTVRKVLATPRAVSEWSAGKAAESSPSRDDLGELDRIVLRLAGSTGPTARRGEEPSADPTAHLRDLIETARQHHATGLYLEPTAAGAHRVWMRIFGRYHERGAVSARALQSLVEALDQSDGVALVGGPSSEGPSLEVTRADRGPIVVRLVGQRTPEPRSWEDLGLCSTVAAQLDQDLAQTSGILLLVGPSDSGKSTTLATLAKRVQQLGRLPWRVGSEGGASAEELSRSIGRARRARADVILVDVEDDLGAIPLCADAALSGCMVIATLKSADAVSGLLRLRGSGLPPGVLGPALSGVLAHRLLPALCPSCRVETPDRARNLVRLAERYGREAIRRDYPELVSCRLWEAPGCEDCGGLGIVGRTLVHEYLRRSDTLFDALSDPNPARALRLEMARQGVSTMMQRAVSKVLSGAVSVCELVP